MGAHFDAITPQHRRFIEAQQLYFVATAAATGKVNVSPKGLDSLRVLDEHTVVWLNGTGSGNETAAHLLELPRMTLMFCSFDTKPLIMRLFGTARAIHAGEPEWEELVALFPPIPGSRQVFRLQVELVTTSCGFGVPLFEYQGQRDLMDTWATTKGPDGVERYQQEKNRLSLDGFPTGLPPRP